MAAAAMSSSSSPELPELPPSELPTYPPLSILHRGENFVVVDKPGGCISHHSEYSRGKKDEAPPVPLLQRARDAVGERINLVHRLDRGASGCVLCAFEKDENVTRELQASLASDETVKTYLCIVRGEGVLRGEDLKEKGWFTIDRPIKDERGVVGT